MENSSEWMSSATEINRMVSVLWRTATKTTAELTWADGKTYCISTCSSPLMRHEDAALRTETSLLSGSAAAIAGCRGDVEQQHYYAPTAGRKSALRFDEIAAAWYVDRIHDDDDDNTPGCVRWNKRQARCYYVPLGGAALRKSDGAELLVAAGSVRSERLDQQNWQK